MSDQLSAAAEAMGIPEALVERSARARAEASGQGYEEVLAAWAGGESVESTTAEEPVAPQTEAARPSQAAEEEAPAPATQVEPAPAPETPPETAASEPTAPRRPAAPARPPILDAPADRPLVPIAGGLGVLVLIILLGFVFPSVPLASDEVRTSFVQFSPAGLQGREVYLSSGCASCHTQAVRAVVADFGLGPVSLSDTNQVVGFRRLGPDLSNVGSRLDAAQLQAVIAGGTHPPIALSDEELAALVSYLSESATAPEGDEPS